MLNKLNNYLDKKRKELLEGSIVKISLKVVANAPKDLWYEFLPTQPPTIKLKIKAVPENGKANRMIEKFVGKYFKEGQNFFELSDLSDVGWYGVKEI